MCPYDTTTKINSIGYYYCTAMAIGSYYTNQTKRQEFNNSAKLDPPPSRRVIDCQV